MRLCTMDEVLADVGRETGCSFSDDHVWTSTTCSSSSLGEDTTPIPTSGPSSDPTTAIPTRTTASSDPTSVSPTSGPSSDPSTAIPTTVPTTIGLSSHYIVDGCTGSACVLGDNGKPVECASDDSTTGSTKGDTDSDQIAVQCCALDGLSAARPGCVDGVTYAVAVDHCESSGMRLCTMDEVLADVGRETGCSFSDDHVWTSTTCSSSSPSEDPTPITTGDPISHYIVDGCTSESMCQLADDGKPSECAADGATKGSTSGITESSNIAVQCCAMDGSSASRPGCVQGVTFEDAENVCESEGMRLCTKDEVLADMGAMLGCSFSEYHVWTSTACPAANIVAWPTPQIATCLYEAGRSCGTQGKNLGVHESPESCANAVVGDDRCGDYFMFSEKYWAKWKCRCCSPGGETDMKTNKNWDLYTVDCTLPIESSTNSNVWIIVLRSFPSVNAWIASALLLLLLLTMYFVYKKRNSAKHNAYAKVQINDFEVVTDEDPELKELKA